MKVATQTEVAADFAESTQAINDFEKAIFIHGGNVAGDVPTIVQDCRGLFRHAEIALHQIGSSDEQQSGWPRG